MMEIQRTKNSVRNIRWGVLQKLIHTLGPFVVRTVLIYVMGAEYAGLNSLFTSILSILSLTEFGFSQAIVYSMYQPIADKDKEKVCALLNIYKKAYRIIGLVILGVGCIIIPLIPHLVSGDVPTGINLYVLYIIYLINTVLSYFLYAWKTSLLSAYQREDVLSRNQLVIDIIYFIAQCLVIIASKDYYLYSLLLPIMTVCVNFANKHSVDKLFPDYYPKGIITESEKNELKKNLIGLSIWKVGGATRNTLDSIVVSMYLGLTMVAVYNNYYYILNAALVVLGVLTTSITAGVGNKIATHTSDDNYRDFNGIQLLYMWIAGWCTVCMLCLYQPFMKLWMGNEMLLSTLDMMLFCLYFFVLKQGDIQSVYYQAAGLWWEGKMRSVVEAVLNIALNFLLGYFLGVTGIILATIISLTICAYIYGSTFVFKLYFHKGLKRFYLTNLYYMVITALAGLVSYWLCGMLPAASGKGSLVINVVLRLLICIIVPNIIFALAYKNVYGAKRAEEIVERVLHRK
jgi:O-antigen/teichoic acid export membrane protein